MQLARADFALVLRHAPLVSIDLVVRDERDRVLLGLRVNRPARGAWFVPGGRIYKNERLDAAFSRITAAELGLALERRLAPLLGVYEHFYDDNALDEPGVDTHYVVIAHVLRVASAQLALPDKQHSQYRWAEVPALLADTTVHENTRAYFR
ncbi:MAG: GDP-mannose mannosyl hydrolase [Deltaproteobacteria bacterium]